MKWLEAQKAAGKTRAEEVPAPKGMTWLEAQRAAEAAKAEKGAKGAKMRRRQFYEDKALDAPLWPEDEREITPEEEGEGPEEDEEEPRTLEALQAEWDSKSGMAPKAYAKLNPGGQHADLARQIIALQDGPEPEEEGDAESS